MGEGGGRRRYDDIELNLLQFAGIITDDAKGTAEMMAPLFGLPPEELATYPHVCIGSVDQIADSLRYRRDTQPCHLAQQPAALAEWLRALEGRVVALAELRCMAARAAMMLLLRFAWPCCAHGACLYQSAARLAQRPAALAEQRLTAKRQALAGQRRMVPTTALLRTAQLCCARGGSLCLPIRPLSSRPTAM